MGGLLCLVHEDTFRSSSKAFSYARKADIQMSRVCFEFHPRCVDLFWWPPSVLFQWLLRRRGREPHHLAGWAGRGCALKPWTGAQFHSINKGFLSTQRLGIPSSLSLSLSCSYLSNTLFQPQKPEAFWKHAKVFARAASTYAELMHKWCAEPLPNQWEQFTVTIHQWNCIYSFALEF